MRPLQEHGRRDTSRSIQHARLGKRAAETALRPLRRWPRVRSGLARRQSGRGGATAGQARSNAPATGPSRGRTRRRWDRRAAGWCGARVRRVCGRPPRGAARLLF